MALLVQVEAHPRQEMKRNEVRSERLLVVAALDLPPALLGEVVAHVIVTPDVFTQIVLSSFESFHVCLTKNWGFPSR